MYVGLITEAFSMNKRTTATTANRLADTYGIYYMFNLVKCVQYNRYTGKNKRKKKQQSEEMNQVKRRSNKRLAVRMCVKKKA